MTDDPTVFHLITRLLNGGAEGEMLELVTRMDDFSFIVGYGKEYLDEQVASLEAIGVETRSFPLIRHYNPVAAPGGILSVAQFLQSNDVDIVHTHSTEAGIIGRIAARLAGTPIVVHTVHGVPFSEDRCPVLNRFILSCERLAAMSTDRLITNTDRIRDAYLERKIGKPEQYRTIPSGIDVDRFSEATPAGDLDAPDTRVLMIARLAEGKGFEILLEAAAELEDAVHVYIAGDGPLEDWLHEEIERRGLDDSVSLLGFRRDVPNLLAATDMLVLPSFREGMPRVITEAMAAGRPVVATNIAGIPDQITDGETGYLIPTGDSDALQRRIRELAVDPSLRERMGEAGRGKARERFSAETMVEQTRSLYDSLLADES
jgi:glycosyltransferase involved in cell wall biosynthesis